MTAKTRLNTPYTSKNEKIKIKIEMHAFVCQKKTDSLHINQQANKLGKKTERQKCGFAFSTPLNIAIDALPKSIYTQNTHHKKFFWICGEEAC